MYMVYKGHPDQWFGPTSYSCCGEDLFVTQLFWNMGIKRPTYLDIGAHHPFTLSNTALLYSRGCRGVNVEANPELMSEFHKYRPEDINVNVGIGLKNGIQKFYMWDKTSGRNTFSEEASKRMEVLTETIDLPVVTLNKIVEDYCCGLFPNFLSIDIEGMDFDVLNQTDLSNGPEVICVEAMPENMNKFISMMDQKGYGLVCRIAIDLIFLKK